MVNPEVHTITTERTRSSLSRWQRIGLWASAAAGMGAGIALAADHNVQVACDRQESMAPAFSFSPSDAQCDRYDENITSRIGAIVDKITPDIDIVKAPVVQLDDLNRFKLFNQES